MMGVLFLVAKNEETNSHNYCYYAKMDKKNKV